MKLFCPVFLFLIFALQLAAEPAFANGSVRAHSHLFLGTVTAYTSSPKDITASGTPAFDGVVACSRKYPLGTIFKIQEKIYECGDRPSRRYDNRLDIWKPTKALARIFGKRKLLIVAVIPADRPPRIARRFNVRLWRY